VLALDHLAQSLENGRKVGLELLDCLAEFRDLSALVPEEKSEKLFQRFRVIDKAANDFLLVLDQDRDLRKRSFNRVLAEAE
jgi:hypothetical protein